MSAVEEVVTEAPAVEAVPKRAMTLGLGTSLVVLAALRHRAAVRQELHHLPDDDAPDLRLAVLALNILTGGSGQFSLGQSAFLRGRRLYVGDPDGTCRDELRADAADRGLICFAFGFVFGQPALRLSGVYLALATFALAVAMPQLLKLGFFEHWTGGVQGLVVTKPDAPFGLPMSQDMWLYYFTLVITIGIYIASVNLLRSRSGRAFMAIRDNEIAASAMGVDVALYKTLAFGVSAGITGVAGGLGAIAVQFVAPDGYTITLAISLFLGMVVGGVGWLPGSIVGSAFIIFVPNIAEGISKGLSGAVFGVLLFLVIFLVPHGARQVAMVAQQHARQTQEELRTEEQTQETHVRTIRRLPPSGRRSLISFRIPAAHSPKRNTTPARPIPKSRSVTSCPTAVPPPPMASSARPKKPTSR
jgi:branched-chain amino acid transport system permease protein